MARRSLVPSRRRASGHSSQVGSVPGEAPAYEHHHRRISGGAARAGVFGVSDGLVSNVSVVLGVAAANPGPGIVRLTGLSVLIGGAFSMAAGEYVSMVAQRELLERELDKERHEIHHRPDKERHELAGIYEQRGVETSRAHELAGDMMRDPDLALETHAREELGIDPRALGSPVQAAVSSFATFALGAFVPLLPWLVGGGHAAILASIVLGGAAALLVGAALSIFTGRSWYRSALRQLLIVAVAAGITYSIGLAVGASGAG